MAMRAVHRRYLRELIPGMLAYVLLMLLSAWWLKTLEGTAARAAVALLPMLPVGFVIHAMMRAIRDQDEFERLIDLQSIAIGGAIAGFGYFSYGMLLGSHVLPSPSAQAVAIWVFPVLMGCFGFIKCGLRLYYRFR